HHPRARVAARLDFKPPSARTPPRRIVNMDNVSFPTPNLYAAPQRNAMRTMIIIACVLVGLLLGLLTLLLIGLGTGFVPTLFGFVLATLPVPIYVALALWIDRFEPEPPWTLATAFF